MTEPLSIGFIGAGLMGHGAARNLIVHGSHKLAVPLGHRKRAPIDDLLALGAREASHPADAAHGAAVVFLCPPSSAEVEAVIVGPRGLASAMAPGSILIDMTTTDPTVTRRIGALLAERFLRMLDAVLGRTPKEAEERKVAAYVGGPDDLLNEVMAQAATQVLRLALNRGHSETYLSALSGVLAELNRTTIHHQSASAR